MLHHGFGQAVEIESNVSDCIRSTAACTPPTLYPRLLPAVRVSRALRNCCTHNANWGQYGYTSAVVQHDTSS